MSRTFGGLIYYQASGLIAPSAQVGAAAGQLQLTRNAIGDVSWNNVAGVASTNLIADNSVLTRPNFNFPAYAGQGTVALGNEYQEAFGTTPLTPGATAPGDPFSGLASGSLVVGTGQSQFGTPTLPWGIAIVDVFAVYSVQTAALTAATLSVNRFISAEAVAFTNTAVLAPTGIALTTTASATTVHVQKVTLPQPLVYEQADISCLVIELAMTTAGTSAVRVYGIGAHFQVEYS